MSAPTTRGARLALACTALIASCATGPRGSTDGAARTYANPVIEHDFPDPAVLRAPDGWYYVYATQGDPGSGMRNVQVARSRDLVQWEHLGDALPEKPRWAASKQKFWAPHVIHDAAAGRYFMYYSTEPDQSTGKCLAVATGDTPAGPFADSGEPLRCGEGIENIDPMAFDDPKTGKRLLYWGSGSKPIKVQELAPDRLRFAPGSVARDLLSPDRGRDYGSLIEGAWVVYRGGTYYLFYSGDRCCGATAKYALMVARAADAFGPFEPYSRPILERNSLWRAPGHNSVIADDAGTDWIVYHAMRTAPQRLMLLDRIEYRAGWPRVAGDQPSIAPQQAPAFAGR